MGWWLTADAAVVQVMLRVHCHHLKAQRCKMCSQAASRAALDALVTAGRVCRAARQKGKHTATHRATGCAATAEFDAAAAGIMAAADAAAASDFDSAAAAVAAADAFGARSDGAAIGAAGSIAAAAASGLGRPAKAVLRTSADVAVASTENGSAATCCRLPSPPADVGDGDECMSPAKAALVGTATGLENLQHPQMCYQSAPPPPLAALALPEDHTWCEL